jgi:hypothetical protein
MNKRKNIISALFIFISLFTIISTAGCSKPRLGIYLELMSDYKDIKTDMKGYLARNVKEPTEVLYLTFEEPNSSCSVFSKGMTLEADIEKQNVGGSDSQLYAPCNFPEGSKMKFYSRVMIWRVIRASTVEIEKPERQEEK